MEIMGFILATVVVLALVMIWASHRDNPRSPPREECGDDIDHYNGSP